MTNKAQITLILLKLLAPLSAARHSHAESAIPDTSAALENSHDLPFIGPGAKTPRWVLRWELARVLSYAKRLDESLREYDRVIAEKPFIAALAVEKAQVLSWKGEQQEALALLEAIPPHELTPENKILAADIATNLKRYPQARQLYEEYLKQFPQDASARFRYARMLAWSADYPAALTQFEQLLAEHPEDRQLRRQYAFTLSWAGRDKEAEVQLRRSE